VDGAEMRHGVTNINGNIINSSKLTNEYAIRSSVLKIKHYRKCITGQIPSIFAQQQHIHPLPAV